MNYAAFVPEHLHCFRISPHDFCDPRLANVLFGYDGFRSNNLFLLTFFGDFTLKLRLNLGSARLAPR